MDHALLIADRLRQSSYNIDPSDTVYVDTALNLSSLLIDWEKSKLPKEFFIEKYNTFSKIVEGRIIHRPFVYAGGGLYGHLDLQKSVIQDNIDYYLTICPDIDFSTSLLYYMIETAKRVKNKYFIVTPQIFRCWDSSWDMLVNERFLKYDYKDCIDVDIYDIRNQMNETQSEVSSFQIQDFKFAGWFDLYNKDFYEKMVPARPEWSGYGPWDFYAINVSSFAKSRGVDVVQHVVKDEIVWFYDVGKLKNTEEYGADGLLKTTYTKFLTRKIDKVSQAVDIRSKLNLYINEWIKYATDSKII